MSTGSMRYVSTRGAAPELNFADALLTGLASDGGLYVPERWPVLAPSSRPAATYVELALEIMWPFVEGGIDSADFESLVADAYSQFDDPEVTPVVEVGAGVHLVELFHGPTLAFKDIALQLVGRLFDHELERRGSRVTIVGATSGDTGSAAIEAVRDREAIEAFILHPHGRVSDVQRRQMTTVDAPNIHNIAIEGTFDDCQDLVKSMFADEAFRARHSLSAVNSINWARVMAQMVYYLVAAERLGGRATPLSFVVPTGNFGNVFAGHGARLGGVPIRRLIVASNSNDILTRLFASGTMEIRDVSPTLSPSMDIQISSNLERLLFEAFGRDGDVTAEFMLGFRQEGLATLPTDVLAHLGEVWSAVSVDDEGPDGVLSEMARTHADTGMLVDPHTAVALASARRVETAGGEPLAVLATAHPAKFPDAVERATGVRPELPAKLDGLLERPERYAVLPNDLGEVQAFIAGSAA